MYRYSNKKIDELSDSRLQKILDYVNSTKSGIFLEKCCCSGPSFPSSWRCWKWEKIIIIISDFLDLSRTVHWFISCRLFPLLVSPFSVLFLRWPTIWWVIRYAKQDLSLVFLSPPFYGDIFLQSKRRLFSISFFLRSCFVWFFFVLVFKSVFGYQPTLSFRPPTLRFPAVVKATTAVSAIARYCQRLWYGVDF